MVTGSKRKWIETGMKFLKEKTVTELHIPAANTKPQIIKIFD